MDIREMETFVERIVIQRTKEMDSMIFGEIQEIATENGFDTKIIINEKAVISALTKQIPKKVNIQRYIDTKCDCGYEFSISYGDGYYGIPFEKKTKYCPDCGQALDWSETNE